MGEARAHGRGAEKPRATPSSCAEAGRWRGSTRRRRSARRRRSPTATRRRRGRGRTAARRRGARRRNGTRSRTRAAAAADSRTTRGTRASRRGTGPRARGARGPRRARGASRRGERGRRDSRSFRCVQSASAVRVCGYSRTVPPDAPAAAPAVSCRALRKVYAGAEPVVALDGLALEVSGRGIRRARRRLGKREVHPPSPRRRHRPADLGRDPRRRPGDREPSGARARPLPPPRGRPGVPVLQPAAAPDRSRERRAAAAARRRRRRRASRRGPARAGRPAPGAPRPIPTSCRAARCSASRSPARSRRERACSWPTSPPAISTGANGEAVLRPARRDPARARRHAPPRDALVGGRGAGRPGRLRARRTDRMKGFALVFRALVAGPARRHPARVLLPVVGVAIGVAAVAAIHHANRSVTASFRDAAAQLAGRSDFVVSGAAGIPLEALASLAFLWKMGSFAPAVTGPAVLDGEPREIVQILGIDWGGDSAVRDVRLVSPAGASARAALASPGSVFVPAPWRNGEASPPARASTSSAAASAGASASEASSSSREWRGVAGGDLLLTDVFTAEELLGKTGLVDRVDVVLDPGVSRESGAQRDREAAAARPCRSDLPGRAAQTAERMVRAFRFNLNALGSLTLLVGIFLIFNAVSIAVLRRRPEIATLRAVGAARGRDLRRVPRRGARRSAPRGRSSARSLGVFVSRAALAAVSGTVSSIYLPAARISGARVLRRRRARRRGRDGGRGRRDDPARRSKRRGSTRRPRCGPARSRASARRRLGARAAAAAVLRSRRPSWRRRRTRWTGSRSSASCAVGLVVAALAFASPLAVARRRAPVPGPLFARIFGAEGRLAAGFFRGGLARNGIAVAALAMALGMTLAMIVTVASIRETVRDLGRIHAPLGSLGQGRHRPDARASWAIFPPTSSRFSAASTASRRSTRSARATRSIPPGGRSRSGPATSASWRGSAACLWSAAATARPSRSRAREQGRGPRLGALRAALRRADRRGRSRSRRRRARAPSGSPACTATTRTTAAPSCSTASSTSRLFGDDRVTSVAVLAAAGVDARGSAPPDPRRGRGPFRDLRSRRNRELRREALRDLRPDLRRDARPRGHRGRRRHPRDRQRPRRVGRRAARGRSACSARSGRRAPRSGARRSSRRP